MRSFLVAFTGLTMIAMTGAAQAKINITVDKDAQMMTVAVDGVERYHWPVSTGNPSHETPNGSFRTFRMEEDHYSKEFDDAPMPHSIFFTKMGHAIHGTESERNLGSPVSHGCVRLSRANATTLYAMVQKDGVLNTTVTLTGSSQVALARNPRGRATTAVARRDPAQLAAPQYDASASAAPADTGYYGNNPGAPQQIYPDQQPIYSNQPMRADDGYIYPADGSNNGARYPASRGSRRYYDAQANPQQQYYQNNGYGPQYQQPQVYAPQPYQPRGLFD